jgi:pyruvate/2-oxoglutarate dehydrogenase complex dihydrolipoamide dehydrogenase (E3) component
MARRAADLGIKVTGVDPDFPAILAQARELVAHSRESGERTLGDRLMRGHARLLARDGESFAIDVAGHRVRANHVVINTGTRARMPKIEGLDAVPCIHAGNWLTQGSLPKKLAIVGGGYIAVEMGQFYRRMGSEVVIIDKGTQPLANEDEDVAQAVRTCLEREGIRFLLDTSFERVVPAGDGWRLTCACPDGARDLEADGIFIATGRRPNVDDLGLESVGVEVDPRSGNVKVDDRLRTNVPGIFAIGDVRGGPMFTTTAWDDGRIVLDILCGEGKRTTDRVVPYAVYTQPEVARVGLSEGQARKEELRFKVCRLEMADNAHAQEERTTAGFVKLVVEEETDRLLGATIVAEEAAEMIHVVSALMQVGAPASTLSRMLFVHPTFGEALQSAAL